MQELTIGGDGTLLLVWIAIVDYDFVGVDNVVMGHILLGSWNDLLPTVG